MKKQPIAVFDIDGTLFRWQLYHELVFELNSRGVFDPPTAELLENALVEWNAGLRDWHDYEMAVVNSLEPIIASLPIDVYNDAVKAVMAQSGHKTYAYTKNLAKSLKKQGYFLLAVSGSQQEIVEPFTERYGFDDCIGALYERDGETFTGTIIRRVPGRKHSIVTEYLGSHPELTLKGSVAVGDTEGDISILEIVDTPIAFNPSAPLFDVAMKKDWKVVIQRKNIAYTLGKEGKEQDGPFILEKTDRF